MAGKLEITLKRSFAGKTESQRTIAQTLGFKRRGQTVIHNDTAGIRGMVAKIAHMLEVKEV